jgi:putative hydrolase of the HAD superfamily
MENKIFVFDFGNVLVRFDPETILSPYLGDKKDISFVAKILFDRLYWDRLDAGTIEDEELLESVCRKLPAKLRAPATEAYNNWYYHLPEIEGMKEIVLSLKERGHRLYLLSNISKGFAERSDEIDILRPFDGCVFSAVCGFVKPSKEIFDHICKKYAFNPADALYIDDSPKNVKGGKNFGLNTYLFDGDSFKLKQFIEHYLNEDK